MAHHEYFPQRQLSEHLTTDGGQMASLSLLKELSFGARVAEDETNELASYFVETDQWTRIVRGEVDVIRGEKGAGKSAIYSLLITRAGQFLNEDILLVSAEKPRGTPVFSGLVSDPPATEAEFASMWKLYLVSLIAQKIREFGLNGPASKRLLAVLEEQKLLEPGSAFDIGRLFRRVVAYSKRWLSLEMDFGLSSDPGTGAPMLGLKIRPGDVPPEDEDKFVSVDELLLLANETLERAGKNVWVLLDRLDVAFAETHELETNALRALFRVYRDIGDLEHIKLKIFIRSDIWKRITDGGFREASHITKFVVLDWTHSTLLNLMVKRLLSNKALLDAYGVDREQVLNDFAAQKFLFYRLVPGQVERGGGRPSTLDWMISRCADGTRKTAPRELIHLLTALREEEVARIERGEPPAPNEQLFDASVFKAALPKVSEARLIQNLYAENPDVKKWIAHLARAKTEQTIETLAALWELDRPIAAEMAEKLVSVGFFEKRGERASETYWVPFLYRDALSMIQGLADEN